MVGKAEMLVTSTFSFPAVFFVLSKTNTVTKATFNLLVADCFNYGQVLNFVTWESLTLYHTMRIIFTPLEKNAFENIVGKGENAGNQHFLHCPQFSSLPNTNFNF